LCALDLASAFDKVNHYALVVKLMDRAVPRVFISILLCWYGKVFTVVRWNVCISYTVKLTAGVRQSGVLSPLLFAVFVDDVLNKLKKSSLGCYLNGLCLNAIMYADDLFLLSISFCDLQRMIDICLQEFDAIDMLINVKKSVCMRIGPCHKFENSRVVVNNDALEWKHELKYLGVYLISGIRLHCNLHTARQKYFRALNGIFSKIGTRSPMTALSLINSNVRYLYCLTVLSLI